MKYIRMPQERISRTRKNAVGRLEFFVTVGFANEGATEPGEIFINIAKEGSTVAGLCTSIALTASIALQHGAPWEALAKHFRGSIFDPGGPSLDGSKQYVSLLDAICDTVDQILENRRREVSASASPTPAESPKKPSPGPKGQTPSDGGYDLFGPSLFQSP